MNGQNERRFHALHDRNEIVDRPPQILVDDGIDLGHRLGADPHHRSVGRLIDDILRGQDAAGAGLVFDDDRATERLRHVVADDARIRVENPPGHGSDDDLDDTVIGRLSGRAGWRKSRKR
jgi:hypothetical protein